MINQVATKNVLYKAGFWGEAGILQISNIFLNSFKPFPKFLNSVKRFIKVEILLCVTYIPFFIGWVGASPIPNCSILNCSSLLDYNFRLLCPQKRWCSQIFINNKCLQIFTNRCLPLLTEASVSTMVILFSFIVNFNSRNT